MDPNTDKSNTATLLSVYKCKAIPNPSSQSSASQELSVLLGVKLICLICFIIKNACQFCTQISLIAFSASENVSNLTPTFNSTAIFTTNTDYYKTSTGILCTSMVTSLCERQGTNWKDPAQIYEDVSRTEEITIMFEDWNIWNCGLLKNEELVQI